MPALAVEALEVRFPGLATPALAIAHLTVESGARLGLTGPSGSGKTTLVNLVTGLERAGRGRLAWDGTDIARLSEGRRDRWRAANVGLVMQDFHLFDGLSARDNVLLPLRLSRLSLPAGAGAEADRLLARVGIERRDQKVETLSRGQKQRVAVARALIARPGILVADEPTASLDAEAGATVASLLLELATEAKATLIVASHDPRLLERLDRVVRLEAGRIRETGG
ncbi:ABC transporter ATP-binding protein [Ancylobacter oerskovii]|uniref:ABC transporter ATP-binding protein n=1 Tax=Ancylobacter oerskovii TaxID=459519 RepID=A0ABW4YU50_9HYPH|nr:ATP-binding cassette domain-containing protein [Ancylobacter oerskovii]MBS7543780.1 ATP-binding cassette domain-containing protein [Ancylobacter oerskovii]